MDFTSRSLIDEGTTIQLENTKNWNEENLTDVFVPESGTQMTKGFGQDDDSFKTKEKEDFVSDFEEKIRRLLHTSQVEEFT